MNQIDRLLNPGTIAVVGASADPTKLTGRPIAYLQRHGFQGRVYPVNPRVREVAGLECFPNIAALPEAPDVGLILLGADHVLAAVEGLAQRGTAAAIILAESFGEGGADSHERQRAVLKAAGSMRILGPNSVGLINVGKRITISASGALEVDISEPGNIAVVSQSGGIMGAFLSRGSARGLAFSKLISTGNEIDLDVCDFIEFLLNDNATSVIALYLETLRRPARFREIAKLAETIGKPIVALKVGRTEAGARSVLSHTGALAGADRFYGALLSQAGVIRAETFSDLLDIPLALAQPRRLNGRRLAVVTSTGGAATLIADAAGLGGFELPSPGKYTAQAIAESACTPMDPRSNPFDLTLAGAQPDLLGRIVSILLQGEDYDAVAVIVGSSWLGRTEKMTQPLVDACRSGQKPLVAYVSPEAPDILRHLNRSGLPAFTTPEGLICALSASGRIPASPAKKFESPSVLRKQLETADLLPGPMNEAQAKALFARFGIPVPKEHVAENADAAGLAAQRLSGKVAVKVLSRNIAHKSDIGGVVLDVAVEDVASCSRKLLAEMRQRGILVEGVLVQEMVVDGIELILGAQRDPQLGSAILLGLGGISTELFGDSTLRLLPLERPDVYRMIEELKASRLLRGFRGRPPSDLNALVSAVCAFADLVGELGDRLITAEINPLFVRPEGLGVVAGDGILVLSDCPQSD